MRLLSCPNSETLFEYVSIPEEMGKLNRATLRLHAFSCKCCAGKIKSLEQKWAMTFSPEPDISSSLMNVFARLQNDETLILKGWKLSDARKRAASQPRPSLSSSWAVRGTMVAGFAAVFGVIAWSQLSLEKSTNFIDAASTLPYARIRTEDNNHIKVQYVQPELLHSVEFETNSDAGNR